MNAPLSTSENLGAYCLNIFCAYVCVAIARQFLAFRVSDSRTPQKWTPTALAVPHSKIDTRDNISIDH